MRRLVQLILCAGILAVTSVTSSQAQSNLALSATSPDAIVKTIYASYRGLGLGTSPTDPELRDLYSARLRGLLAEEDGRIQRDGLGRLDFDVFVDAQDCDVTDLSIGAPRIGGDTATVDVSLLNFGEPRRFRFQFVLEDAAWRIDEIVAVRDTDPWQLTALLSGN